MELFYKEENPCSNFVPILNSKEVASVCYACGYLKWSHKNRMVVREKLRNHITNKLQNVLVTRFGEYRWNSVYRVYNKVSDYSQLTQDQIENIIW